VNEGQAFILVAAAIYACIELTRIRLQFTRLREGLAGIRVELERLRRMVP
jgi:hypothetical protein